MTFKEINPRYTVFLEDHNIYDEPFYSEEYLEKKKNDEEQFLKSMKDYQKKLQIDFNLNRQTGFLWFP